jgi:hypothetical protein
MRKAAALLLALAAACPDADRLTALALLYCPGDPGLLYDAAAALSDEDFVRLEVESNRAGLYDPAVEYAPMAYKYRSFAGPDDTREYGDWKAGFLYVVRCRRRGDPTRSGFDPFPDCYARPRHWADPRGY